MSFFTRPFLDTLRGLEARLDAGRIKALGLVLLGLLLGLWIYVPVHELAHAAACVATGGTVSELEIDPLFGGALLARVFPWVEAGGEYAGRLAGFDTGGSDLVYLATDLGPYLLTLLPGVWLLRKAGGDGGALLFGAALPLALAPFLGLTGDAYEIGSILTTRLPPWAGPELRELLRGDDLVKKLGEIQAAGGGGRAWAGAAAAAALGALWAFVTYALGGQIARALGRGPVPAPERADSVS